MVHYRELSDPTMLAPEEAFKVLGNETRIEILRVLGYTDAPLSFSELYDLIEYDTTANFNYHLDKLEGHFVRKTDEGYDLRQAGRSVVQAVVSGAVTDAPVVKRTQIDHKCPHCGAPIEVRYHLERVEMFCTECAGTWGAAEPAYQGYLGRMMLPPAGFHGRTTEEAVRAARTWENLRILANAVGICPHCAAPIERDITVCDDHDTTGEVCEACHQRYAVQFHFDCTNCIYDGEGTFSVALAANTDLLAFLTAHGLNPVSSTEITEILKILDDYDEVIRSIDPFEAEFTFTIEGDAVTLTVDDDLTVVDVVKNRSSETI
jgi:predicted amidophosphoribosyltransferase/DNA-binding transcriptional ArsR family regulator